MSEVTEKTYSVTLEKKTPSSKFGVAFQNDEDGSVVVRDISKNGVAANSALKEGDKIKSINGKEVTGMTAKETATLMVRAPSGPLNIVASYDEEMEMDEESSPLVIKAETILLNDGKIAQSMSGMLGLVILFVQVVAAFVICAYFDYGSTDDFTTQQYIIFRDIMVMLLLGFGYRKYSQQLVQLYLLYTVLYGKDSFLTFHNFKLCSKSYDIPREIWP